MNLSNHVRRNAAVAVAAIAVALGAAGAAHADTAVAHESVATDLPTATAPAPAPNANTAHLTLVAASAPTAPRSPTATAGNARVKLAWLAPSSNGGATINTYRVQRATSAAGPWTRIATPTARSYTANGLSNGTRYHFRIAAHNAAGWGPYSTVVNTVPRTVPSAVPACSATQGGGGGASSPTMSIVWQHPLSDGARRLSTSTWSSGRTTSSCLIGTFRPTTMSFTVMSAPATTG